MKHSVIVEHSNMQVRATINGTVLASTTSPILLKEEGGLGFDPIFYFPMEDVKTEFLTASNTRSNCYLKGEAKYWSLQLGELKISDVAWEYFHPITGMGEIKSHIAFYSSQIKVEVHPD